MKKILILSLFILFGMAIKAQPWIKNLPQNKSKSQLTLFDYKTAFDQYWKPFNVKDGYYSKNGVKKKASGWKQFNRWYTNWEPMVDKYGYFPNISALEMYNEIKEEKPNSKSPLTSNWNELGPRTSFGGYAGIGRINCISFHNSNNDIYWVGTPSGGLWKTTDNGTTWSNLSDFNDVIGVSDIAITSDYETSHILYIATGDRDASDNYSVGILKSTDDGNTWNYTGLKFNLSENVIINRLLIDPNNDNILFAATSNGLYETIDAGAKWTILNNEEFIDMEFKPKNSDVIYASNKNGDIYLSTNKGLNWDQTLNTSGKRVELAVTLNDSSYVYALIAGSDDGLYGVYKSTNSGLSFKQTLSGSTKNLLGWYNGGADDQGGQGWYDLSLAVSPQNKNTVLLGGVNTWRSKDGGTNWKLIAHWSGSGAPAVHADVHSLHYRKDGTLFECNDGGIYVSSDNGTNFSDKTNGIVHSQIYKIGVSQTNSDEIICGLQDNGTKLKSATYWRDVKGGDGMDCMIDFNDNSIQYGTTYNGKISRTDNHWTTSKDITPNGQKGAWVTPYTMDPNNSSILYAGFSNVWKSTNKGDAWSQISSFNSSSKVRSIAVASSNSDYIYAADNYNIWKTEDGGNNWSNISTNLPGNVITNIAVKYDDSNTVWVTLGSYDENAIYETTDGGNTWTNISAGLPKIPAYSVVQNNKVTNEVNLYIGTELGVFFKHGKSEWIPYNTNLPNVKIKELEIYYNSTNSNCLLRAGTYGRGLWESPLSFDEIFTPSVSTNDITNLLETSATLNGEILNDYGDNITESGFVYSLYPDPKIGEENVTNVTTGTTSGNFTKNINNLTASSIYYVKAYSINSKGVGYGPEKSFTTSCGIISSFPYNQGFNAPYKPNCWTEEIVNTVAGSPAPELEYTSTSSSPSTTAYEGTYFINFNSYDCDEGSEIRLYSPTFNSEGLAKMSLSFYWYESSNYKSYQDKVIVQYSTDGSTWHDVQTILRSSLINAWTLKTIELPPAALNQTNLYIGLLFHSDYGYNCHLDKLEIISEPIKASVSATSGCNNGNGIITVNSNSGENQTFYLCDDSGNTLDSWTGVDSSHNFIGLNDGTYRGKVELNGIISNLSENSVLTNSTISPTKQTGIDVDNPEICSGQTITLTYNGGSGNVFAWYNNASMNTKIGEGNNFQITPTISKTFYGRWENGCGVTTEDSINVNVLNSTNINVQPTDINADALDSIAFIVNATGDNLIYQWRQNGENLNSENNDTLIINPVQGYSNGYYTVKITGTCGEIISDQALLNVNGTAITEFDKSGISIFPNPSNGIININMPNSAKNNQITVTSVSGKTIFTNEFDGKSSIINLSNLEKGTYIINIKNNELNINKTILIK